MNNQLPLLDMDLLSRMAAMRAGATTLDAFALGLVVASAQARLNAMRAALSDPDRLADLAHAFKGVSGTCGLQQLATVLGQLEHAARHQLGLAAALSDTEACIVESLRAIDDYLSPK